MNRKETTEFLGNVLVSDKLTGQGKYYAREVSIDCWTKNARRVDFMQFLPAGVIYVSDIEKGIFICYEVKSCIEDVYSGNGLNFIGEKNYLVTTMECYKKLIPDMHSGKLYKHLMEHFPETSQKFGVMVPIPRWSDIKEEFDNPTPLDSDNTRWQMRVTLPATLDRRRKSMNELLFDMLRSGT